MKKVYNHLNSDQNKFSEIYDDLWTIGNNIVHAGFDYKDDKEEMDKSAKYINHVKK